MMRINKNGIKFIAIVVAIVLLFIGYAIWSFSRAGKAEQPNETIDSTMPTMPEYNYVKTSTKSWGNCAWLGGIDKSLVTSFTFTEEKMSKGATEAWIFDDIMFYLFEDGRVEAVIGQPIKITGSMNGAFKDLPNMKSISGFSVVDTSEVSDMSNLFNGCTSLSSIDLKNIEMNGVLLAEYMFYACEALDELDMSEMDLKKVVDADYMFAKCKSLNKLTVPDMDRVLSMSHMFEHVGQMSDYGTTIHGNLSTEWCEDMSYMFSESRIPNLTFVENFNTSNLKNAEAMFADSGLMVIDLSKWNTHKLENISKMFWSNMWLDICNTDGWDLPELKTCEAMFFKCTSLDVIDLNWTNLKSLSNTKQMFQRCYNVATIDITCMNGLALADATEMFADCETLKSIYCDGFTAQESILMFDYCLAIQGAVAYDETMTDASMANTNGYFSKGE